MKTMVIITIGVVLFIYSLALIVGGVRTVIVLKSASNTQFNAGSLPDPQLDGFYPGTVQGYGGAWRGKALDAKQASGINKFEQDGDLVDRYPFKTYTGPSYQNKNVTSLKIDYNVGGNPLYVRLLVDEVVQTAPGHYLGKIHIRILPGLPITVGFFRLESK